MHFAVIKVRLTILPKRGREPPVTVEAEPLLVYADSQVVEYEEAYYSPEYLTVLVESHDAH